LVAKILVADDNSNIQKMVGLALRDQGIDVVAVGNGEAAVRKIADVRPDLVLADVFMPVRNGYEVCQYVKSDSTLAHIPVILLVGAFDPLDEQEAQRVGADGVLKKPFVPPDPLISMVKSALARAGGQVGEAAPAPRAHAEPARVTEMLSPRSVPAASEIPSTSSHAPMPEMPSMESEPLIEATLGGPEPVKIAAGSQPLAFGSLLETTETGPEEEIGYATTARPELERDWKSGDEEEDEVEEEEEDKESASWRRDAGDEALEAGEAATGPVKDWRETAFSEAPARRMKHESWVPQKEISNFEEAAETEQSVGAMVKEAPVAETTLAPAGVSPFTQDTWAASLKPKTGVEAVTMEAPALAPSQAEPIAAAEEEATASVHAEAAVSSSAKIEQAPEPQKPAGESSWFSVTSSPWDAEVQKANRLASTWDAPAKSEPEVSLTPEPEEAPTPSGAYAAVNEEVVREIADKDDPAATVDALTPSLNDALKERVEAAALPTATVAAIREEAQQIAETAVQEAPAVEATAKTPEPNMEDMVAKVLSKMSPEMLQAVTREILKPVVEAMVRDELKAKK
jgi:CheY-like chemotaxis protein